MLLANSTVSGSTSFGSANSSTKRADRRAHVEHRYRQHAGRAQRHELTGVVDAVAIGAQVGGLRRVCAWPGSARRRCSRRAAAPPTAGATASSPRSATSSEPLVDRERDRALRRRCRQQGVQAVPQVATHRLASQTLGEVVE